MGDYAFRRQIDAGLTIATILANELADAESARLAAVAERQAARSALLVQKPQKPPRERTPKPPRERTPKPPRPEPAPVLHGSLTMYRRGCRDDTCPADPSCSTVALAYYAARNRALVRTVQGHGTNASFVRGCRCEPCQEAHRKYHRDYAAKRRAEPIPTDKHGTVYGYVLGCHDRAACPASPTCTDVQRAAETAQRRARGLDPAPELVDAVPAIRHIQSLRSRGLTYAEIAAAAKVGRTAIAALVRGRYGGDRAGQVPERISAERAARILAIDP
jgi:hypothetical protein